jgi:lysophospholipase L1-like esterase
MIIKQCKLKIKVVFILKMQVKKKRRPVLTAFTTSLIVSLAFFTALFALNIDLISDYFGNNPCVTGTPQNPAHGSWNNHVGADNSPWNESFKDYIEDTIFIGDSRTVGLKTYSYVKAENVYALNGQNHQSARSEAFVNLGTGRLLTVAQAIAVTKPKRMVVSYGINGISSTFMSHDTFFNQYSLLIDELKAASPNSIIIIQSILPVSNSYEYKSQYKITNDKIDSYNVTLKNLAKDKGCKYLDTSGVLKDGNNCLLSEYDSGDGLHFDSQTYAVLLQYLDQHRIY